MNAHPPHIALRFLRWFCREDYLDEIEGDLIELFDKQRTDNPGRANWNFFWQVLMHFRPEYIRAFTFFQPLNTFAMYKNYFKITWRSLWKQKLYSLINIGGLSIGLTCFILIFLYIQHEWSYDRFYDNDEHIYRIYQRQEGNVHQGSDYFAVTPVRLASTLIETYPEVSSATSIVKHTALLGIEDHHFLEQGLWADQHFFDVFSYPFLLGDPSSSLTKAESIVLTQSLAQKIFGNKDPLGQIVFYQDESPIIVTGVIPDLPTHSSLNYSFIMSINMNEGYIREMNRDKWYNMFCHTFFTLTEGANPRLLEQKMPALLETHMAYSDTYPFKDTYFVQPLHELHLQTGINAAIGVKGNPTYIYLFSIIAIIVLFLVCINYVNLALARSINRTNEVGIRKVIGAKRRQLIIQFLGESVFITFLSLLIAIGLTHYLSPVFGQLLNREIVLSIVDNRLLIPGLGMLMILVGLLAGSYPALFISSFRPIRALKGTFSTKWSGWIMQRTLVVSQYVVSIVLIIGSIVMYKQFQFIQNKPLGYDKAHIITLPLNDRTLTSNYENLKAEWMGNPQVVAVTSSSHLPTNITSSTVINDDDEIQDNDLAIYESWVDDDYLEVFGIELIAGRFFSPQHSTDIEEGYVLNETAVRALGWTPEEAIGKQFTHEGTETIIGVVKDFHMHSMHLSIQPLMLRLRTTYFNHISVKVYPEDLAGTVNYLNEHMKSYSSYPFEYSFLDQEFDQLYKDDVRLGEMFRFFTILSIFIASIGLFGLAAFSAQQRTKEIGIRKVLGASVQGIIGLMSQEFMRMVLIGFVIAVPIAWYTMHLWLEDFAYRVALQWWMFVVGGLSAILIAFLTISSQSIRAAVANPVDSLRNE